MVRSAAQRRVSNHEARTFPRSARALSFETRFFEALLRMRN
jgi:hypothetical protein